MKKLVVALSCVGLAWGQSCASVTEGWQWDGGSRFNGFKWFPNSQMWQKIDTRPVSASNTTYYNDFFADGAYYNVGPLDRTTRWYQQVNFSPNAELHVVDGTKQPRVNVYCGGITDEWPGSGPQCYEHDPTTVPLPIPPFPRVQEKCYGPGQGCGGYNTFGDKHVVVLDKSSCVYYELYNTYVTAQGKVYATAISIFDALGGDLQRPFGWTSGSQSGMPWWMGALRYEEILAGKIEHAIAVVGFGTVGNNTKYADVSWASHAGANWNNHQIPYGARFRLKSSFDTSSYSWQSKIILQAMKEYGITVIDGGSFQMIYEGSNYWDYPYVWDISTNAIFNLTNFEAVEPTGPIKLVPNDAAQDWPSGSAPSVTSFTVNGTAGDITVAKGQSVTLAWTGAGVDPTVNNLALVDYVGVVRGAVTGSVATTPVRTTTYRVHLTNRFGQRTSVARTVTVN